MKVQEHSILGYENIADIGKERIRRVIKNIESKHADTIKVKECSLPGMTEGRPMIDLGFRFSSSTVPILKSGTAQGRMRLRKS
ncbi:MAG: hypothetical protein ACOX2W_12910 [Desulfomonilia bacterium]